MSVKNISFVVKRLKDIPGGTSSDQLTSDILGTTLGFLANVLKVCSNAVLYTLILLDENLDL